MELKSKIIVFVLVGLSFVVHSCSYLPSESDHFESIIYAETPDYISLSLDGNTSNLAFMFLPGGLVDPHAYVSLMERIALDSIHVIILKFEANLAIFELTKYKSILDAFPEVNTWYVGGHSLGGIAALSAVGESSEQFNGLILLGTYPSESFAISDWDKSVLSIYAENDSLSTLAEIAAASIYLPNASYILTLNEIDTLDLFTSKTLYYKIMGGNHAQFGDYGAQEGDGVATISVEEQHEQVRTAIKKFIIANENDED
jgi:pimeloyl-ACP methyl ester carboxylesterase